MGEGSCKPAQWHCHSSLLGRHHSTCPLPGLRSRQECSPRAGLGHSSTAHTACSPQAPPSPHHPPQGTTLPAGAAHHPTPQTRLCTYIWSLGSCGSSGAGKALQADLAPNPWGPFCSLCSMWTLGGIRHSMSQQGLKTGGGGTPWRAHHLLPLLSAHPSLSVGPLLGEHPITLFQEHPWGTSNRLIEHFLSSQNKMDQGRMDQGWQHGRIKHSLSCPALTDPKSKCPQLPGHPHQPTHRRDSSASEQRQEQQLEESPCKPEDGVPCLLWLPGLLWLPPDLDSPARAAEVTGALRKPRYATRGNQSMPWADSGIREGWSCPI